MSEASPYVRADVFLDPNRNLMHVIQRETIGSVKTLRPIPDEIAFPEGTSH